MFGVRLHVFRTGNIAGGLEFVQAALQQRQFLNAPRRHVQDSFVALGLAFLGKIANHRPLIALDGA